MKFEIVGKSHLEKPVQTPLEAFEVCQITPKGLRLVRYISAEESEIIDVPQYLSGDVLQALVDMSAPQRHINFLANKDNIKKFAGVMQVALEELSPKRTGGEPINGGIVSPAVSTMGNTAAINAPNIDDSWTNHTLRVLSCSAVLKQCCDKPEHRLAIAEMHVVDEDGVTHPINLAFPFDQFGETWKKLAEHITELGKQADKLSATSASVHGQSPATPADTKLDLSNPDDLKT